MKSKGFTLIELAVVLAIIAVLAAVLTPLVSGYIDQARTARAQADVRTIADAIKLYNRDTGRWPIYDNNADYVADNAPQSNAKLEFATAAGTSGTLPQAGSGWALGATVATSTLESYMNNDRSGAGSAAFPKAGFRGPYVGAVDTDPWGHQYLLNAGNLRYKSPNNGNHAYVISAGPNGNLETSRDVPTTQGLSAGGDDIIAVIK
jgi:prepilin-type N-terminal cleavage/methylation domain-containing protein